MANLETISKILSHPTWDILAVFFFIAAGFFYGISSGKTRLIAVLFSLYVSAVIFENFSYIGFIWKGRPLPEVFIFRSAVFAVLIFLLTFLFNKFLYHSTVSGTKVWWEIFILSFLEVGLLVSFIFQLLPAKELFTFSPLIENIFASSLAFFWWLVLPIIALFVIVKKR